MEERSFEMGIKSMKETDFQDNATLETFKHTGGNVLLTTIDDVIDWGRSNSVWPLTFATQVHHVMILPGLGLKFTGPVRVSPTLLW
jgi:NADH:ubiquinone oxidoreductase subunit B-like Fe-S oxidoreductase